MQSTNTSVFPNNCKVSVGTDAEQVFLLGNDFATVYVSFSLVLVAAGKLYRLGFHTSCVASWFVTSVSALSISTTVPH